jgi:glc operon protein GlcG
VKYLRTTFLATLLTFAAAGAAHAQLADKKALTLAAAREMAPAAEAQATKTGWNLVIVIVDDAGNLLYLERMDGVQLASIEVATRKARTAALYRRPSKDFADRMASGNITTLALPEVIPLEGGLPIVVDGQVIGAIAASGAQAVQDAQAAQAGIDALLRKLGR